MVRVSEVVEVEGEESEEGGWILMLLTVVGVAALLAVLELAGVCIIRKRSWRNGAVGEVVALLGVDV
jgi:hypothetical protein